MLSGSTFGSQRRVILSCLILAVLVLIVKLIVEKEHCDSISTHKLDHHAMPQRDVNLIRNKDMERVGINNMKKNKYAADNSGAALKPNLPNIIFILSDDLGWNDVGYHNSEISTPTIDRLAKEGVRLENYYAQSKCTPSRASFMTGLYQSRNGLDRVILASESACLPTDLRILPQALKNHGYKTHLLGKWHLGMSRRECLPNQRGFDTFFGYRTGAQDYYKHTHGFSGAHTLKKGTSFYGFDFWENETAANEYTGQYATHLYVKRTQDLIETHARTKEPMFLFLSLSAVHSPLQVPYEYIKQYEGKIEDNARKIYAGMTSCMDEGIKNITDALRKHNLLENTVMIFSSDNGGDMLSGANNFPLKGMKSQYHEGGIKVVGFVNSPLLSNKVQGAEFAGLMGIADWFPTIVQGMAGGTKDETLDGVNMWNAIRYGLSSPRSEYLYAVGGNCDWHYGDVVNDTHHPMYGTIRVGDWKLRLGSISQKAFYPREQKNMVISDTLRTLHNIKLDPYEENDVYMAKGNREAIKVRHELIERLQYHCRRRRPYVPQVEREEAHPRYRNYTYSPWLSDWNDLEWQPTKNDLQIFEETYITI